LEAGGWLQAAETEEKYVMTWTNSRNKTVEENIFEMPTGGAAIMKQGPNLVYFARKNNV
jgi:photosystem I subunit 2